jgi:probable F420-dependent oxidoreductase
MNTMLKKLNQALGVMIDLGRIAGTDFADVARLVEDCGYSCLWTGENLGGRDPFVTAARLLSLTTSLTVGISVANIWKREPLTMMNGARALSEFYEGRFVLGVGVSHQWLLNRYQLPSGKPLTAMRNYLAKMKSAPYIDPAPAVQPAVLVGALLPKMVKLAATETEGVFLNLGVPTHTARTRQLIGPDKWLGVCCHLIREKNSQQAHAAIRKYFKTYARLENYRANFRSVGYTDADFENSGSDRLLDDAIPWGDEGVLKHRIKAHFDAGANHVAINPMRSDDASPDLAVIEALAPQSHRK